MVTRAPGYRRCTPVESKIGQVNFINKQINDSNRIVFADEVIQALRQQCNPVTAFAFDESFHLIASTYELMVE